MSMILNGKKSLLNVTFIGGETPQEKVVTPTTEEQVVQAEEGYTCLSKVTINGVNSSIDENIQPENIKKDVNILGVTGTLESGGGVKEPAKAWFYPTEYNENGYPSKAKTIGLNEETLIPFGKSTESSVINLYKYLEYIEINEGVTSLSSNFQFGNLNLLKEVIFPSTINNITQNCFNGCDLLETIVGLNISNIEASAFKYCQALKNVSFPNVTTIGTEAFYFCNSLISIEIPNVTSIGYFAFSDCRALLSVVLPKAINLGEGAFYNCNKLKTITLGANQVCTIASTTSIPAKSNQHITIKVPSNLIESYKTATNWSTHYNNGYITFEAIA